MRPRFLFFLVAQVLYTMQAWSQETVDAGNERESTLLLVRLGKRDIILPLSSIEWGTPDGWSITSRYIHSFGEDTDQKTWLHNLTMTLSPGSGGGRFGFGYQLVFVPPPLPETAVFGEARLVLLRTWGEPLDFPVNQTFAGVEFRLSPVAMINGGVGYYRQLANPTDTSASFWGFHIGIGF